MRWLVLVCFACGDNLVVDEPAETHGGDRLELYWYEMEGGGRERVLGTAAHGAVGVRFFDRERREDCDLVEWADGVFRCTPGLARPEWFSQEEWPSTVFADPRCTALRGLSSAPREYFLHGEWIDERFITSALVRSGSLAEPGEYYELRDGACVGPVASDGNRYLWSIEGGVPGSALVELVKTELASTTRIGHEALVGADGTRVHLGFYDLELETACTLIYGEHDVRCAPGGVEIGRTFADDSCTRPAVADAPADTRFAFEESYDTGCTTVWELGATRTMPVFEIDQGACVQTGIGTYRAGTPVSLPVVELSHASDPGRIVERRAAGASIGVFDTATQAACSVHWDWFDFDGLRCVPDTWWAQTEFLDAECTRPIQVSEQPARPCSRVGRFARSTELDALIEIGERIDTLFTVIDERCVPLVPRDGAAYHLLGAELPETAFASATLVHAP